MYPLYHLRPILRVHELGRWLVINVIGFSITQVAKGVNVCECDLVRRITARDPLTVTDEVATELQVVFGTCRDTLSRVTNHRRLSLKASIGVGHHATWLANVVAEAFDLLVVEELEFINRVDPLDVGDRGSHVLGESQTGQCGPHGSNSSHLVSCLFSLSVVNELFWILLGFR